MKRGYKIEMEIVRFGTVYFQIEELIPTAATIFKEKLPMLNIKFYFKTLIISAIKQILLQFTCKSFHLSQKHLQNIQEILLVK